MSEQHPFFIALERWNFLQNQIAVLQAEEKELRQGLFNGCFPDPREGVNKLDLPDGRVIKGTQKVNRSLNEAKYKELIKTVELTPEERKGLFKIQTKLVDGFYKKMPDERKALVADMITAKPGLPALEIVVPESHGA